MPYLRIAICDDDEMELCQLLAAVHEYNECHPAMEINIDSFLSIDDLSNLPSGRYDVLLLDILMPQMSGIDYMRLLREAGGCELVIFITASPEFALDAFAVNATQYLLKPITTASLFAALDKAFSLLRERARAGSFAVSTQYGVRNLYFHNIVLVECARHLTYFHMADGSTVCSKTLRQSFVSYISPLLLDDRFVHTHHSFIVNKDYVVKLNQRDFELYGGHIAPISKDRLADVKSSYLRYLDNQSRKPKGSD